MRVEIEGFGGLPERVRESALSKLEVADPRIVSWKEEADGVTLTLREPATDELAASIRAMLVQTIGSFRLVRTETLLENDGSITNTRSPFSHLVETGQVALIAPGTPVYQGHYARRLEALDRHFREQAWRSGALEQFYPSTVPATSLARNGYLTAYPQHALLVAAIHADIESLSRASAMAGDPHGFGAQVCEVLGDADEVLAPTVCYRCFESLRCLPQLARPLSTGRLFTGLAICHRREDKALEELSRLQSFRMREVVFFGLPDFVEEHRSGWISRFADLLRSWDARFQIVTATDPFFMPSAAQKRAYQSMRRLKYECQMYLPHADKWLAVASFNNHEATLASAYELDDADGARLHSGCVGFGYDRLLFGVLSQFGWDSARWPGPLKTLLEQDSGPQWSI